MLVDLRDMQQSSRAFGNIGDDARHFLYLSSYLAYALAQSLNVFG
jgi:hypothetical protein